MKENKEIYQNLSRLFEEIATREKRRAIESDDYGTAFILAILEVYSEKLRRLRSDSTCFACPHQTQ